MPSVLQSKKFQALEQSNNDISEAVKWLEAEAVKQGWTKLERSAARTTKEGVFGVAAIDNVAAITEVNCETDFVARNSELRGFAAQISEGLCGGKQVWTWPDQQFPDVFQKKVKL